MEAQHKSDSSSLPSANPVGIGLTLLIAGVLLTIAVVSERDFAQFWTSISAIWSVLLQLLGYTMAAVAGITILMQGHGEPRQLARWVVVLLAGLVMVHGNWGLSLGVAVLCVGMLWFARGQREPSPAA